MSVPDAAIPCILEQGWGGGSAVRPSLLLLLHVDERAVRDLFKGLWFGEKGLNFWGKCLSGSIWVWMCQRRLVAEQ